MELMARQVEQVARAVAGRGLTTVDVASQVAAIQQTAKDLQITIDEAARLVGFFHGVTPEQEAVLRFAQETGTPLSALREHLLASNLMFLPSPFEGERMRLFPATARREELQAILEAANALGVSVVEIQALIQSKELGFRLGREGTSELRLVVNLDGREIASSLGTLASLEEQSRSS